MQVFQKGPRITKAKKPEKENLGPFNVIVMKLGGLCRCKGGEAGIKACVEIFNVIKLELCQ